VDTPGCVCSGVAGNHSGLHGPANHGRHRQQKGEQASGKNKFIIFFEVKSFYNCSFFIENPKENTF
jgi:hypothetical protein